MLSRIHKKTILITRRVSVLQDVINKLENNNDLLKANEKLKS